MRFYQSGKDLFFQSEDFLPLSKNSRLLEAEMFFRNFLFTKHNFLHKILDNHQKQTGLEGYAHLEAHGGHDNKRWYFFDSECVCDLQDWVNNLDGKALAIFLSVCNEGGHDLVSANSVLVYPSSSISRHKLGCNDPPLKVYIPRFQSNLSIE